MRQVIAILLVEAVPLLGQTKAGYPQLSKQPVFSDASYPSLLAACAAAGRVGVSVAKTWTMTTQTIDCPLSFNGGSLEVPSGQIVRLTGALTGSLSEQIFHVSDGGRIILGAKAASTVSCNWFGARDDGLDATANANSAAISSCLTAAVNVKDVTFPGGNTGKYVTNRNILIKGGAMNNYQLHGVPSATGGAPGTVLAFPAAGLPSGSMIEILDAAYVQVWDLFLAGNSAGNTSPSTWSRIGIYQHRTSNLASTVTATQTHNVWAWYFKTGHQIGSLTYNESNDELGSFYKERLAYCGDGIHQSWPNAIGNTWYDVNITNCTHGVRVGNNTYDGDVDGSFTGDMNFAGVTNMGNNASDFYFSSSSSTLTINDIRTEGSTAFMTQNSHAGVAGSFASVIVNGGNLNALPSGGGEIINLSGVFGHLHATGLTFGNSSDTAPTFVLTNIEFTCDSCDFLSNSIATQTRGYPSRLTLRAWRVRSGSSYVLQSDITGSYSTQAGFYVPINGTAISFAGSPVVYTANTRPTTIPRTGLTGVNVTTSQVYTIIFNDVLTTIQGGFDSNGQNGIRFAGMSNPGSGATTSVSSALVSSISFIHYAETMNNWQEIGRTYRFSEDSPVLYRTLPSCSPSLKGARQLIGDSSTNTWGATITGSGRDEVMGWCNGSNWTVYAK